MIKRTLFVISIINFLSVNVIFGQIHNDSIQKSIFPQKGDWAIGIDAAPLFQYVGNLFSQNGNPFIPSIKFNAEYPNSIFFKYKAGQFITIRTLLTIGLNNTVDNIINTSDESNPHELIESALNIGLIAGVERKKSIKNRLVSYYGIQAGVQKIPYINGSTIGLVEYKDSNDNDLYFKEYGGNNLKILSSVFIGLEYYILPKFAISGEIDLEFSHNSQSKRYRKRGTDDAEIIDNKKINYNIKPGTSGNIGVFIYF